jgi:signal peptidase
MRVSALRQVGSAVASTLALALSVFALLIVALAVAVPAVTGSYTYTILTQSMKPNLPPSTLVVVRPERADDLRVGDVITYQLEPGKPAVVTHRIVEVTAASDGSRLFTTRGDNNAVADADPVKPPQIRGRLWYAIPFVGWLAGFRSTQFGSVVVTIVGGALLVYGIWMSSAAIWNRFHRAPGAERRR